jgi:hypothetical protein
MDRRDRELLDTLKRYQPPSRRDGPMILAIVGVFLAGMTGGLPVCGVSRPADGANGF